MGKIRRTKDLVGLFGPCGGGYSRRLEASVETERVVRQLAEVITEQQKIVDHLATHLEALKAMMFEHRPAFREEFRKQVDNVDTADVVQAVNRTAERIEMLQQTLG